MSMKWPFSACSRYRADISLLAVGAQAAHDAEAAARHLGACPDCREYAGQVRRLGIRLGRLADVEIQPSPEFRREWRSAVRAEAAADNASSRASIARVLLDLVLSVNRPALAGLAAVWIAISLLRLTTPAVHPLTAHARPPAAREMLFVLKAQYGLTPESLRPAVEAGKTGSSDPGLRPRSEQRRPALAAFV